jgi:hypothetical protein
MFQIQFFSKKLKIFPNTRQNGSVEIHDQIPDF